MSSTELLPQFQDSNRPLSNVETDITKLPVGDDPDTIKTRIPMLRNIAERCYIYLAKDLWNVCNRKLYTEWGFNTYDDYLVFLGMSKEGAYRLRRIFDVLVTKCGITIPEIEGLGKSKAERLLPVVNKFNARSWIEVAKNSDYGTLLSKIDNEKRRNVGSSLSGKETTPVQQDAVAKVEIIGTDAEPELSDVIDIKPKKLKVKSFQIAEDSESLLNEAINEARRITKSPSDGFNLICIAQQFLASRLTLDGKDDNRLMWFLRNFEKIYGGRLLYIKSEEAWEVLRTAVENRPDVIETTSGVDTGVQQ